MREGGGQLDDHRAWIENEITWHAILGVELSSIWKERDTRIFDLKVSEETEIVLGARWKLCT